MPNFTNYDDLSFPPTDSRISPYSGRYALRAISQMDKITPEVGENRSASLIDIRTNPHN